MNVNPIPTTRIDKDHPKDQIIGDFNSAIKTRRMTKISNEHAMKGLDKKNVNLPNGKRAIGTKWVFRNKKDERGIVVRNKARLVAQGYTQEEGIDYDKMDVKSGLLISVFEEYDVLIAWYETLFTYYENGFRSGNIDKTLVHQEGQKGVSWELTFFLRLQVQQKEDGIFISQDKYVVKILKKFDFPTVKIASTPMEPNKALVKDKEADSVDVHLYGSMIGSLMYLIASRPDIIFAVCACARFQVTPKMSHLHDVKRIFRYLKVSDYAESSLIRKAKTGGCHFLARGAMDSKSNA
ncbi:putative ribonuclease H-like domain-containing protein [Tanacetum coccineum]|uniref:Ribonuclease H-like domain-containing protein n=1 Tax=Tanacetum coccineum TaxID=301880 RepID=A0ABQ5DRQ3_9ASTR